jgi:predicted ribosomally synthesized peptide with SipW-like signal peptide
MKKILLSLSMITVVAVVVIGATGAFFSDTETSTGNTFTAGAIDLKVGSQATYNGVPANYGNWQPTDLLNQLFFDLTDVKPGDNGENTISLNVNSNPAWSCATIAVTADDDVSCTEPELTDDPSCSTETGQFNGDMASNLSFVWWPDNGDNIMQPGFEYDHKFFLSGSKLKDLLDTNHQLHLTLADSLQNFFGMTAGSPLEGNTTYSVGTAWCMGNMSIADTGVITCDGAPVNNGSQTDSLKADITFSAVQQRNNTAFRCVDTYKPQ